jgi:predicted ATPase/DNA-binding CsgD family transcriptional regulator/Tfp pilus assembly protein PilF
VPLALGALVRQRDEVDAVSGTVRASRLVSVVGAPGVGKSRVCAEVVARVGDSFGGGVVWVDVAGDHGGISLEPLLDRPVLVVLDGCERDLDRAVSIVESVLRSAPNATLLISSQAPLGIPGERCFRLRPLGDGDATQLFWHRAAAAGAVESPGEATDAHVGEIVRRTGGIPRVIEAFAARAGTLAVAQVAAGDLRDPALDDAVARSLDRLDSDQRDLFRRLAIFDGGFTIRAAEAVAGADSTSLAALVAASLVERSPDDPDRYALLEPIRAVALQLLHDAGEVEEAAEHHCWWFVALAAAAEPLLTSRHQHAVLAYLDADDANLCAAFDRAARAPRSDYDVLRLATSLVLHWVMRGRLAEGRRALETALAHDPMPPLPLRAKAMWGLGYIAHLTDDVAVARAALESANETFIMLNDFGGQARAVVLNAHSRVRRGRAGNEESWLDEVLPYAESQDDDWCVSMILAVRALVKLRRQETAGARQDTEQAVAVARQSGDRHALAFALEALAQLTMASAGPGAAEPVRREVLLAAAELNDPLTVASALVALGATAVSAGEVTRAEALLRAGFALAESVHARRLTASALNHLGALASGRGDHAAARQMLERALAESDAVGDTWVPALHTLARVYTAEGNPALASALLGEAVALARDADARAAVAQMLLDLSHAAGLAGDGERAEAAVHEALDIYVERGDLGGIGSAIRSLAGLAASAGNAERAARLLGAAQSMSGEGARPDGPLEPELDALSEQMSVEALQTAIRRGQGLAEKDAVALARRSASGRATAYDGWESLTNAEQDVAVLVAEGLSNPEIATRLFISRRTVENHVSHALSKLGLRSRVELAVEAVRRGDLAK